jgi:hypothetical protein
VRLEMVEQVVRLTVSFAVSDAHDNGRVKK